MTIGKINHFGVIVPDIEEHYKKYMSHLMPNGLSNRTHDPLQGVNVAFLEFSEGVIELVEPTDSSSPISKILEKKPAMFHHVCLESDALEEDIEVCRDNGQFVISSPKPAVAFGGRQIAFVMGRDGLLWELLEVV